MKESSSFPLEGNSCCFMSFQLPPREQKSCSHAKSPDTVSAQKSESPGPCNTSATTHRYGYLLGRKPVVGEGMGTVGFFFLSVPPPGQSLSSSSSQHFPHSKELETISASPYRSVNPSRRPFLDSAQPDHICSLLHHWQEK